MEVDGSYRRAPRWSVGGRAGLDAPTPGGPGNHAQLHDARPTECQDDGCPEDHGEQQRDGQWQMTVKDQEGQLDALQVLKDEDEDQHQRQQPNDDRRPGSTEAGVLLARIGLPVRLRRRRRRRSVRAQLLLLSALHPRTPVTPSNRSLIVKPCLSITYSNTPLSWLLVRILMMLSARRSSEPISRYRSMTTLWKRNDNPPIGSVMGPSVVVSLVITTEAPAARIHPTRLRE